MLYWAVKFPDKRIVGYEEFPQDQVVFYKGMFGVPSYLVWWMAADKTYWLTAGDIFEFMVFESPRYLDRMNYIYPDPNCVEDMIITSIVFDVEAQMFKLTAVSYFWSLLANTKMLTALNLGTHDNPVSGKEMIDKLVEIANSGQQRLASVESRSATDKIKYVSINPDPEVSVLDLITDICLENAWEFYIGKGDVNGQRTNVIYIADKLLISDRYILPFEPEAEHKQSIQTSLYMSITTESVWCEPILSYGRPATGRCIWVKFFLGNEGGLMTVMLQRVGWYTYDTTGRQIHHGTIKFLTENEFLETLDTGLAIQYGLQRKFKYPLRSFPILIGKIYGKIATKNKENYTNAEWSGDLPDPYLIKDLAKRKFKTEFTENEPPVNYLKNSKVSTPFAGNGVGLLFPQVEGYRTILSPDGERDVSLIGPGYFGPEDEIPYRESPTDFRLQLPNGAMIWYNDVTKSFYITSDSVISLQVGGWQPSSDLPDNMSSSQIVINDDSVIIAADGLVNKISTKNTEVIIQGGTIKIDGGSVDINGVTIMKGGLIKCTQITAGTQTVPPKIPP